MRQLFRRFLLYFLPSILIVILALVGLTIIDYSRTEEVVGTHERLQIDFLKKTLARELESVGPDLRILIQSDNLQEFLAAPGDATRSKLERSFARFAQQKQLYQQVRYIDDKGMERVRVNLEGGTAKGATPDRLQDKSGRYYFREGILEVQGAVYVSPIDLNVEDDRVEMPHRPMIRFASPVFDKQGRKRGIVILNYRAARLLSRFDEMSRGSLGRIELVNHDGYWIRARKKEREWGFMFGRSEDRFQTIHGDAWSTISALEDGQVRNAGDLLTFTTLNPRETVYHSLRHTPEVDRLHEHTGHQVWKIVSDVPRDVITARLWENFKYQTAPVLSILALALGFASWRFASHRLLRERLQRSSQLHAKVFSSTTDGVFITDSAGTILDANSGFERITGYARDEVVGKNPRILASGRHDPAFYQRMWSEILSKGFWQGEIFNRQKGGTLFCELLRISSVVDEEGRVSNYVAVFSDISERKSAEEALQWQARRDPLTGLANRPALDEFLDNELARVRRSGNKVACLYLDLNDFKPINDSAGHEAGDAVLREVADRLNRQARESDIVARVGGDEFVVGLADIPDPLLAKEVAERILHAFAAPIETPRGRFSVGASLGLALYPDDAPDRDTLIKTADARMYEAKRDSKRG